MTMPSACCVSLALLLRNLSRHNSLLKCRGSVQIELSDKSCDDRELRRRSRGVVAIEVMGLPPITSIAAGHTHCLMTDGQRVWAMGSWLLSNGTKVQLLHSTNDPRPPPCSVDCLMRFRCNAAFS